MRIVFFGTSSFAARVLTAVLEKKAQVVAVVTRPDRPKGRNLELSPPPVKEALLQLRSAIPIYQPEKASTPEFAEILRSYEADLFVVVAYGEIIKKNLLEIPKLGCVNIHASLLPKYRGAAPIQRAIMDGVEETGITIIKMTPQMDAGDVISMASISVLSEMTYGDLEPNLCLLGTFQILQVIQQFEEGSVKSTPQDPSQVSFAPKLEPQEERIDWLRAAQEIHNQIRAFSPKPGAWCLVVVNGEERRLKIKRSEVVLTEQGEPGEILHFGKVGWVVSCKTGALRLLEVQLEGKKALAVADCIKGMPHRPSICR